MRNFLEWGVYMKADIKWNFMKISIPYVMGQMSEKKVEHILASLKENGFDAKLVMPNPSAAVIILEEDKKNLVIEPQQITYSSKLEGVFAVSEIQTQFENILNALLIDDKNQYFLNMEGISETADSHTESRENFKEKYMLLDDEIYGVGYRFLIRNENMFGEFKIEPLVTDKRSYYYQWILNKAELVSIAEFLTYVNDEIEKDRECCYCVIRG